MNVNGVSLRSVSRPDLPRRAAAEGLAAFALVFAGCGAIVADARYAGTLGTVGVGLVFGLVIMVMVYATGHLSGAHINPAVTLAFTATRHFPPRDAAVYVFAQTAGAIAAALALLAVWPDQPAQLGATVPSVGAGSALVYEGLLSAILMFVIMAVATDTRAVGAAAAIAIGGADRSGRPLRRTGHGSLDEPGPEPRAGAGQRHLDRLLGLRRRPGRGSGARRLRLPAGPRRADRASPRPILRLASGSSGAGCRQLMANVLFVCLHNAGRSQISRALFERAAAGRHEARSAGTQPGDRVHPEVAEVMAEIGIDVSGEIPHRLERKDAEWADLVVTMGCGDECPYIPGRRYVDWDLPDPKGRPREEVRATRDEIARRVEALLAELGQSDAPSSA